MIEKFQRIKLVQNEVEKKSHNMELRYRLKLKQVKSFENCVITSKIFLFEENEIESFEDDIICKEMFIIIISRKRPWILKSVL